jgi:hypothetical protein
MSDRFAVPLAPLPDALRTRPQMQACSVRPAAGCGDIPFLFVGSLLFVGTYIAYLNFLRAIHAMLTFRGAGQEMRAVRSAFALLYVGLVCPFFWGLLRDGRVSGLPARRGRGASGERHRSGGPAGQVDPLNSLLEGTDEGTLAADRLGVEMGIAGGTGYTLRDSGCAGLHELP